jgi:predicted Zn-dependent protease
MVLRLSLLYALLDGAREIDEDHVEAAYALWRYSRQTAERIWGTAIGDPLADKLMDALRRSRRLTGDQQLQVFSRHIKAEDLERVRRLLVENGHARIETEDTGGRPAQVLVLCEESEGSEETPDLRSHNSLSSHPDSPRR